MVDSIPSANPANLGTLIGTLKEFQRVCLMQTDDMLPAQIITYDRTTNLAQVQPMIMMVTANDAPVPRAPIASIPVLQLGAGNFMLNFPLNPGDLGWIKANDRDISFYLQTLAQSNLNTFRMHSFEDAIFIPSVLKGYTINSEDSENVVLQTLDGTQRVSIWPDRVKVTSSTQVIIEAPNAHINSSTKITLDSPLTEITGTLSCSGTSATGNATFNGTVHATVDVTAQTVSLHGHVHSGVQSGSSNTNVPVP